jgi:alkylation response protein AidB-like acyl-CoA dehydrogenase
MDFTFTPEQDELRDLVRGFLAKHAVRSREPGSYDEARWRRLVDELGLIDIPAVEQAVVLEETGRALLALPYLSTVVAHGFLSTWDGRPVALALDGTVTAEDSRLTGSTGVVMDADVAGTALVAASGGLYACPLDSVGREAVPSLDLSRPGAVLRFDATPATRLDASDRAVREALGRALAVEALGVAAASLESTVEHLRTRHQFGAALATFQALRHRVADLVVALEAATSTTWYAVRAPEEPGTALMAKLVAAEAAYRVTAEAIQLHGGIGFTWEHDAHRYFKRATVTRLTHGDPVALRRELARLLPDASPAHR